MIAVHNLIVFIICTFYVNQKSLKGNKQPFYLGFLNTILSFVLFLLI